MNRPYYEILNARIAGATCALFLVVGRWNPERLFGVESPRYFELNFSMLFEPRQWVLWILMLTLFWLKIPRKIRGNGCGMPSSSAKSLFLSVIPLFLYFMISASWAPDPEFGLLKAYDTFLTLSVLLVLGAWYRSTEAKVVHETFWLTIFSLTGILVLCALASLSTGRLAVLGGGPNVFARLLFLFAASSLGVSSRFRIFGLGCTVLAMALIVLSGSRGGMLAAAFGALTYVLVERSKFSSKVVGIVVALFVGAIILVTPFGQRVYDALIYRVVELTFQEGYTSDRDVLFEEAIEIWQEKPVFGHGASGWAALQYAYSSTISSHPHNILGEMLCEGGLVAAVLFLFVVWKFSFLVFRHRKSIHVPSLACSAMYLMASQFSGDFFDSRGIFLCAILSVFPHHQIEVRSKVRRIQPRKLIVNPQSFQGSKGGFVR